MVEGHQAAAWDHTSALMYVVQLFHSAEPPSNGPEMWNPLAQKHKRKLTDEEQRQIAEFDKLLLKKELKNNAGRGNDVRR